MILNKKCRKKRIIIFFRQWAACSLLPILIFNAILTGGAVHASEWIIENPYASVDWKRHKQYKANFHTHTTLSDGRSAPHEVIDAYVELGYAILAITDHDTFGPGNDRNHPDRHRTTWPWTAFGRDPEAAGMVAVEGNEISRFHHIGSYFCDYGNPEVVSGDIAIKEIGSLGGLAVLFHPGRYRNPASWYSSLYRAHPHLIGFEIYNQGDRHPDDRKTWDAILTDIISERPVWGFSNDDMHNPERKQLGRNWNVMLLPELSAEAVRRGMEEGTFFFVYAPEGHDGGAPPVIRAIAVDSSKGTIHIDATGYESIEWISDGRFIHRGDRVNLSELADPGGYIRAVIRSENSSLIGTQPFRIQPGHMKLLPRAEIHH
jgi:hypothetical protein